MAKYLNLKPVEFDKLSAKRKAAVKWEGRILLPKYDGCFAMVCFYNGKLDFILSRDGKTVKSMDHIEEDLLVVYPNLANLRGGWAILGEAWNPGKEFAELSGTFRRQRPQPQLGFAPFDIVPYVMDPDTDEPMLSSDLPYVSRLSFLEDARNVICGVCRPCHIICESEAHALAYAKNYKAMGGYDGAIASDPDAPYVVSDGHGEFLKVKPLQSFSLRVVSIDISEGEKTGRRIGTPAVRFKNGACGIGTGFDNALAADFYAAPQDYIGRIMEVACMGVYAGEDGMMREPRFVGWRDDVINPDY